MTTKVVNTEKLAVKIQSTNFVYGNDENGTLEKVTVGYMATEVADPTNYMSGNISLTPDEIEVFPIRDLHKAVHQKLKSLFLEDTNSN